MSEAGPPPQSPVDPSARVVLVTGASAGIGRAVARRFLNEGWAVHNASRRPSGVPGVLDHAVDLSDLDAVEALARTLRAELPPGAVLSLVHNAAVMEDDAIDRVDRQAFERTMRLNVTTPALLSSLLVPAMAPGSSILYVGSTLSVQAIAGRVSYVTSKHALVGLMRSTCQDLFGRGIHTALICPGFTDTEMVRPAYDASAEFRAFIEEKVSAGRLIHADEMAEVVFRAASMPVFNGSMLHAHLGQRTT